jgi:hypothetical protein
MKWWLKNIYLLFIGIVFLVSCSKDKEPQPGLDYESNLANKVSIETAMSIAKKIPKKSISSNLYKSVTKTIKDITEHKTSAANIAFYVINYDQGGFIIIAADNRISPILAYSEKGTFSSEPSKIIPPVAYWIKNIEGQVQTTITKDLVQNAHIKLEWDALTTNNSTVVNNSSTTNKEPTPPPTECPDTNIIKGPLLTSTWGQGDGYNNLVPANCEYSYYTGNKAYTGCVATAMAQVMRFFHKPNTYNWANMPDYGQFGSGTYDIQLLMKDAGESVNMQYSCSGSGAYSTDIAPALINTFHFSNAVYANFNLNTVVQNINYNKPVILTGGTNSGGNYINGHAWVCDGYLQSTVYFRDDYGNCTGQGVTYNPILHMNWGWDGDYNYGYYNVSYFNPGNYTFNYLNMMIYNITL